MLNQGARLQLLNSVISSLPIYHLCSFAIPQGILKQLERIQRQCLWRGSSDSQRKSLAAWDLVCRPKSKGGMGIMNLQLQNKALLIKHLHKVYNKADIPWVFTHLEYLLQWQCPSCHFGLWLFLVQRYSQA